MSGPTPGLRLGELTFLAPALPRGWQVRCDRGHEFRVHNPARRLYRGVGRCWTCTRERAHSRREVEAASREALARQREEARRLRALERRGREERRKAAREAALADLRELVAIYGSMVQAGERSGLGEEQVWRWLRNGQVPTPRLQERIRAAVERAREVARVVPTPLGPVVSALDRETVAGLEAERAARVAVYAQRAALGLDLWTGKVRA